MQILLKDKWAALQINGQNIFKKCPTFSWLQIIIRPMKKRNKKCSQVIQLLYLLIHHQLTIALCPPLISCLIKIGMKRDRERKGMEKRERGWKKKFRLTFVFMVHHYFTEKVCQIWRTAYLINVNKKTVKSMKKN